MSVYLCVIRDEMIVFKKYLGQSASSDSIRALLGRSDLVPTDSWSELGLTYEKYNNDDLKRNWGKIVKSGDGLQNLDRVPSDGTWGIMYEYSS
jgi:hypothetical protein